MKARSKKSLQKPVLLTGRRRKQKRRKNGEKRLQRLSAKEEREIDKLYNFVIFVMRATLRRFSHHVSAPPSFDSSRPVVKLETTYTGHELDFVGEKDGSTLLKISAGKGPNAGPMQLVLFGLASCALTDVSSVFCSIFFLIDFRW